MTNGEAARKQALAAISETRSAAENLIAGSFGDLWHGFELLRDTFNNSRHVYVCGNGGSAADAQHFVAELVVRLDSNSTRRPLPAIALTTDTSILTAAANDLGFEHIFSRQLEARGQKGDLLILISTSGNSPNLLVAAKTARTIGIGAVALLGKGGGSLRPLADCAIIVPSDNTQRIQEVQILCLHLWCEWLETTVKES